MFDAKDGIGNILFDGEGGNRASLLSLILGDLVDSVEESVVWMNCQKR